MIYFQIIWFYLIERIENKSHSRITTDARRLGHSQELKNGSSYLDMRAHKELEIGLLERGPAV
jgi:hypothetical protein